MQTVSAAFTAEEKDEIRKIVSSTEVSWKKVYNPASVSFTIGVSLIGSPDAIASSGSVVSDWNRYIYDSESAFVTGLNYSRELQMPVGGVSKALAEVNFDNTTGRYLPDYMGGSSEFATAILPRRPVIINSGFNYDGVDTMIPQFVGITSKTPEISMRDRTAKVSGEDFLGFLANNYVDHSTMFTAQRSDQVIETILTGLGFATAQFSLDVGINTIPFGIFETGKRFLDIINDITQAEFGNFYQDEVGTLRFTNRAHWDTSPYNAIQKVITTSMVIEASVPSDDHIVNVVEINASPRAKVALAVVYNASPNLVVSPGSTNEIFISYDNPMLAITNPTAGGVNSSYLANSQSGGGGSDLTSSVSIKSISNFAQASKITFQNNGGTTAYITSLIISGRAAEIYDTVYTRKQDDSSVTAYEQRPWVYRNDYIQDRTWADGLAQLVLNDLSDPDKLQELTIRAIPELQLGDFISWQGRSWQVYGIKTDVSPSSGFVQRLKILRREIANYFIIGVSTIGGPDQIAP